MLGQPVATSLGLEKPALGLAQLDKWPTLPSYEAAISDDGKYAFYGIENVPEGSSTLVVRATENAWERRIQGASLRSARFLVKGGLVVLLTTDDRLCLLKPGTDEVTYISNVVSYEVPTDDANRWLAYCEKNKDGELVVRDLNLGKVRRLGPARVYKFNATGSALVFQKIENVGERELQAMICFDTRTGEEKVLWRGAKTAGWAFNRTGDSLAFLADENVDSWALWHYRLGMTEAKKLATDGSAGVDHNLLISSAQPHYSYDGTRIFFKLIERRPGKLGADAVKVDIWNYKDLESQDSQVFRLTHSDDFASVIAADGGPVIRLEQSGEKLVENKSERDEFGILVRLWNQEAWWDPHSSPTIYCISTIDGRRKQIEPRLPHLVWPEECLYSPSGNWMIWFDRASQNWRSLNSETGAICDISQKIPNPTFRRSDGYGGNQPSAGPFGLAGWGEADRTVFIYDEYDLWEVDPSGHKPPVNVTRGFGRSHHLRFRLMKQNDYDYQGAPILKEGDTLILDAYDPQTKFNGFYRQILGDSEGPGLLSMGPYVFCRFRSQVTQTLFSESGMAPIKAKGTDVWIVNRQSTSEAPNFYVTRDFKAFTALSAFQPQKDFNWMTAELVHWKSLDGSDLDCLLYKPEDFDPEKKYPVILNYYEQSSDQLYQYIEPELTRGTINIPWFVSRGYLVMVPDVYYKVGHPGQGAVNSVISAAEYLRGLPYVDGQRLGIQGHSFGGYQTNYLVTHSQIFAAAAEMAGNTDLVSSYGGFFAEGGTSNQFSYEIGQGRIGATLWERPDLYIENSPIFKADTVTTPLLMVNNKSDRIPFSQAAELFFALRRLGKPVWLLQYDEGNHIVNGKDALDYTIRLSQFFDHYLKGTQPPKWMTEGVPAKLKGIEMGYELDTSGKLP